jgi:hypothetical protein
MKKNVVIILFVLVSSLLAQNVQKPFECKVINSMDTYFLHFIKKAGQNNFGYPKLKLSAELLRVRNQQILTRKSDYPLKTMYCDSVANDSLKWLFKNGYSTSFEIPIAEFDSQFVAQNAGSTKLGESVCTYYITLIPTERKGNVVSLFFMVFRELKLCGTVATVGAQGKDIKLTIGDKLKIDNIEMFSTKSIWSVKPVVDGREIKYGSENELFKDVDLSFILSLESIE